MSTLFSLSGQRFLYGYGRQGSVNKWGMISDTSALSFTCPLWDIVWDIVWDIDISIYFALLQNYKCTIKKTYFGPLQHYYSAVWKKTK